MGWCIRYILYYLSQVVSVHLFVQTESSLRLAGSNAHSAHIQCFKHHEGSTFNVQRRKAQGSYAVEGTQHIAHFRSTHVVTNADSGSSSQTADLPATKTFYQDETINQRAPIRRGYKEDNEKDNFSASTPHLSPSANGRPSPCMCTCHNMVGMLTGEPIQTSRNGI